MTVRRPMGVSDYPPIGERGDVLGRGDTAGGEASAGDWHAAIARVGDPSYGRAAGSGDSILLPNHQDDRREHGQDHDDQPRSAPMARRIFLR